MSEVRRTVPFVVLFVAGVLIGAWLMVLPWVLEALGVLSRHRAQALGAAIGRAGLAMVVLGAVALLTLPAIAIRRALLETALADLALRHARGRRQ